MNKTHDTASHTLRRWQQPHLGLLTVRDWGEGDHVAICIHEAGVVLLPVQQVQVPGGSTVSESAVNTGWGPLRQGKGTFSGPSGARSQPQAWLPPASASVPRH